jgi:hypothetical protein
MEPRSFSERSVKPLLPVLVLRRRTTLRDSRENQGTRYGYHSGSKRRGTDTPVKRIKEDDQMGLRINSNIEALNAHRNLGYTTDILSKSMEKLSSGSGS